MFYRPGVGWYSKALSTVGPSRWFARIAAPLAAPIDRTVYRLTRGRRMAMPSDLPALMLTTTGRHSGQARTVPLLFVSATVGFAVAGTNWGRRNTPDWVLNLEANPRATIEVAGEAVPVVAESVDPHDHDGWWERFEDVWPGYRSYRKHAAHRSIRIFVLHRI